MNSKQPIYPEGPYLQSSAYTPGICAGDLIFVSGQGPFDPRSERLETGNFEREVELTLRNIQQVLSAAGASLRDVAKVTVYLQNINDFARMNAIYEQFFTEPRPARTTVQTVLMAGISVEIDAIAIRRPIGQLIGDT